MPEEERQKGVYSTIGAVDDFSSCFLLVVDNPHEDAFVFVYLIVLGRASQECM